MNKLNLALCTFVIAALAYRLNLEIGSTGLLGVVGSTQAASSDNALAVNSLQAALPEISLFTHNVPAPNNMTDSAIAAAVSSPAVSVPDIIVPALLMDTIPDVRVELTREGRSIHRNQARTHRKLPPSYPIYDPPPTPSPTKH